MEPLHENRPAEAALRLAWETPRLQRIRMKDAEKHEHGPHPDEGQNHMS